MNASTGVTVYFSVSCTVSLSCGKIYKGSVKPRFSRWLMQRTELFAKQTLIHVPNKAANFSNRIWQKNLIYKLRNQMKMFELYTSKINNIFTFRMDMFICKQPFTNTSIFQMVEKCSNKCQSSAKRWTFHVTFFFYFIEEKILSWRWNLRSTTFWTFSCNCCLWK